MANRGRTTVILLVLFGGLLVASLLINVSRRNQVVFSVTATPDIELFPAVQPENITRMTISDSVTGQRVTWMRDSSGWQAVNATGQSVAVNLTNVARMIQILATLRYNRVLEESNMAQFGLTGNGRAVIEFDAGAKTPYRLRIGDQSPYGDLTYVQRDIDPSVYLVSGPEINLVIGALPGASPTP